MLPFEKNYFKKKKNQYQLNFPKNYIKKFLKNYQIK
jgi:hypothetical protein